MDILHFFWNFFFGSFEWVYSFITQWNAQAFESGFSPSKGVLITYTILLAIAVGSSMTSMTIAEVKNRFRPIHCVFGFLLPVAYPFLLYYVLPEFKIPVNKEREVEEIVDSLGVAENEVPESELRSVAKADKKGITPEIDNTAGYGEELNQHFFTRIMADESGNPLGPFILELDDGKILEISRITSPLPKLLAVEIGEESADAKTIRLPYSKIVACHLKDDWLREAEIDEDYDEAEEEQDV